MLAAIGKRAVRRSRVGTSRRRGLALLALMLMFSGVARIGGGVGHALADDGATEPAPQSAAQAACEPDGGSSALLQSLREREARVLVQEAKAADREQALALARKEIDAKMAELVSAEEILAATIAQADQAAEKDVAALVAMYESMKPKDAAHLFAEMEPNFAAGFLARMRPESGAAVLAGLEPAKAYTISVILAGRNANAPKS